ncbi:hypothetical protein AVEN_74232-1 [Araneus ventricosus]|uniref:Uncharacterized protein n=1 Tax=Araneus ventricosus TaxID=182803 RepID=A0A4Y2EUT4_ARAVE|nr:hypothetical protein AVEN_74232-1 [Araneus ventricosus]
MALGHTKRTAPELAPPLLHSSLPQHISGMTLAHDARFSVHQAAIHDGSLEESGLESGTCDVLGLSFNYTQPLNLE